MTQSVDKKPGKSDSLSVYEIEQKYFPKQQSEGPENDSEKNPSSFLKEIIQRTRETENEEN